MENNSEKLNILRLFEESKLFVQDQPLNVKTNFKSTLKKNRIKKKKRPFIAPPNIFISNFNPNELQMQPPSLIKKVTFADRVMEAQKDQKK